MATSYTPMNWDNSLIQRGNILQNSEGLSMSGDEAWIPHYPVVRNMQMIAELAVSVISCDFDFPCGFDKDGASDAVYNRDGLHSCVLVHAICSLRCLHAGEKRWSPHKGRPLEIIDLDWLVDELNDRSINQSITQASKQASKQSIYLFINQSNY